jgi:hypothetical protein
MTMRMTHMIAVEIERMAIETVMARFIGCDISRPRKFFVKCRRPARLCPFLSGRGGRSATDGLPSLRVELQTRRSSRNGGGKVPPTEVALHQHMLENAEPRLKDF